MLLVVRPGAPSSVLAPGLEIGAGTLLGALALLLGARTLLVVRPGAPSSVLAPRSKTRSP